jgi:hypothetical protein
VKGEGKWTIENNKRLGIASNWIVQKVTKKHTTTQFVATWTLTILKEVGNKFPQNFLVCLWVDLCKYRAMNLGHTRWF